MNWKNRTDEFYVWMKQAIQDENTDAFEQFVQKRKILIDEMIQEKEVHALQEIVRRDEELMLLMKGKKQTITDSLYRQNQMLKAMDKYDR